MKYSMFILFVFLSNYIYSLEGLILTLETPLFEKPDIHSKIVQYVRKGKKIYIHNKHNLDDPNQKNYFRDDDSLANFIFNSDSSDFYKTLDRKGMDAYILKDHVKLIFKDERESGQSITPFKYDPTDYRIEEPIPSKYPFIDKSKRRAIISFMTYTPTSAIYNYPTKVINETFGMRFGVNISLLRRAKWDMTDRLYFGVNYHMSSQFNSFSLENNINSQEIIKEIGIGPIISYDLYRLENYRITTQWSLTPLILLHSIEQINLDGDLAQASFVAINFKNKLSLLLERFNVFPDTSVIFSIDIAHKLPHTITAKNQNTAFWNQSSDTFSYPFETEIGFLFGIQTFF